MSELYDYHFRPIRFDHHADRRIVADESQWLTMERKHQFAVIQDRANKEIPEALAQAGIPNRRIRILLADIFEPWEGRVRNHSGKFLTDKWEQVSDYDHMKYNLLTMQDVIRRTFELVDACPNIDFLLPTAWPERVRESWPKPKVVFLDGADGHTERVEALRKAQWKPKNLYLGAICETQQHVDKRLPDLLKCRDLSPCLIAWCWPMREGMDLTPSLFVQDAMGDLDEPHLTRTFLAPRKEYDLPCPDWVIAGGGDTPCNVDWLRSLRDQCSAAGVPLWLEQLGHEVTWDGLRCKGQWWDYVNAQNSWGGGRNFIVRLSGNGSDPAEWPEDLRVREVPDG